MNQIITLLMMFIGVGQPLFSQINVDQFASRPVKSREIIQEMDTILPPGKTYGLFIACQDYQNQGLNSLIYSINDAKKLRNTLYGHYNFSQLPDLSDTLFNPSNSELSNVLDALANKITSKDYLLIFYSGHGQYSASTREGFWQLRDANPNSLSTWYSNETLVKQIMELKARKVLLIIDACFSGSIRLQSGGSDNLELYWDGLKTKISSPTRTCFVSTGLDYETDDGIFVELIVEALLDNQSMYVEFETVAYHVKQLNAMRKKTSPYYGILPHKKGQHIIGMDFVLFKQ